MIHPEQWQAWVALPETKEFAQLLRRYSLAETVRMVDAGSSIETIKKVSDFIRMLSEIDNESIESMMESVNDLIKQYKLN